MQPLFFSYIERPRVRPVRRDRRMNEAEIARVLLFFSPFDVDYHRLTLQVISASGNHDSRGLGCPNDTGGLGVVREICTYILCLRYI